MPNIDDLFKRPSGRSSSCALVSPVQTQPSRSRGNDAPTRDLSGAHDYHARDRALRPGIRKAWEPFRAPSWGLLAGRRNQRRDQGLGRTGGRPPKLTDDDIEAAKAMLANPDIGVTQIAHRLGVSPATLYRYIPAARSANMPGG